MQCETRHGSGSVRPLPIPCGDCGGSGVAHCCDGDQAQSDPGDETPDWPGRLGRMEREATGCADDCCHPDHRHLWQGLAEALDRLAERSARHLDLNAMFADLFGKRSSDTHDQWRKLNEGAD